MLTTEITSRKISEGLKEAGYRADLELLMEKPELGWVNVMADEKAWMIDGVMTMIEGHPEEAQLRAGLSITYKTTLVFEKNEDGRQVLDKLSASFIGYEFDPVNEDGSMPVLVYKEVPLIDGDKIEMSQVIQQFEAFKTAVNGASWLGRTEK